MQRHDTDFVQRLNDKIDNKTKPRGSLGRIEGLAKQLAMIQGNLTPTAENCSLTIFAGDHGIVAEGVSAFPQGVTRQMIQNFLDGGAAANVFAKTHDVTLTVVDAGVAGTAIEDSRLLSMRIDAGTKNSLLEAAMTQAQYEQALSAGQDLGRNLHSDICCFGEMGIGNTSAATLICSKVLELAPEQLTGIGTGLDEKALANKQQTLSKAAARTPNRLEATAALREYGGFEIVMMTGAMLGAAATGKMVIVDGFIATAAALCASEMRPPAAAHMVFSHCSSETGHRAVLNALKIQPLLNLDLRLGEGTGALLAVPLVRSAAAMLKDMASFDDAGVSGPA